MMIALWISGGVVLIAVVALFFAPPGLDVLGPLFRTGVGTALLIFLGRLVGGASHRRPPNPVARNVVVTIFATVVLGVLALKFSPNWTVAFALWYLVLAGTGAALNRWCDAPERYAVFVATFCVVVTSLILMVIAAASTDAQANIRSNAVLVALWPNVIRIATHPGDAAWTWFAWRVADRLRTPEPRRKRAMATPTARPTSSRRAA